jgi:hypothetical protein
VRERRAVHALGAEHVDVVELGELLGREGLGRTEGHVASIVHDDVNPSVRGDDLRDASIDRVLPADVGLEWPEIDALLFGIGLDRRDLRRVATNRVAHRGTDGVP